MNMMLLEDCCEILDSMRIPIKASDRKEGPYPYYGANGIQDHVDDYIFDDELVLLAEDGGNFGSRERPIAYRVSGKCWVNNHAHVLKPKNDSLDVDYLCYSLMFYNTAGLVNGATRQKLTQATMREMLIPMRSIEEQKHIIEMLNRVVEIKFHRQNELVKLDELIKARFIELFGDTENNPFSWEKTKIGTVIQSCEAGWSGNGVQREKRDGEVAVLKVSAVTKGYFIPEECKVLDDQRNIKKYIFPEKGDLLFSRANTREMVGATAIVTQDYPEHILPDKLWKIRFTDDADVYYMKYVLSSNSIRSMFSAVSTGTSGSMYNVSMEKFKSITIPLPPRKLQNQFAAFVKQVNKSKFAVQKALDNAQLLFDSLMQKYFG